MARTNISFGHKHLIGGVVRGEDAKQELRGSSIGGHEARIFHMKNRVTWDARPSGCPVGSIPV
jgi:hypothetical protein